MKNIMNMPDVLPHNQGGNFIEDYDDAFENACVLYGIPFALLKAHAQRESVIKPNAIRQERARSGRPESASYGLMQILWWKNSNRFAKYGYSDDTIGDGSLLFDPTVNTSIAAQLIADNWRQFGNIRDTINAYNTGVAESVRVAPGNYVDDVLAIWSQIVGQTIS